MNMKLSAVIFIALFVGAIVGGAGVYLSMIHFTAQTPSIDGETINTNPPGDLDTGFNSEVQQPNIQDSNPTTNPTPTPTSEATYTIYVYEFLLKDEYRNIDYNQIGYELGRYRRDDSAFNYPKYIYTVSVDQTEGPFQISCIGRAPPDLYANMTKLANERGIQQYTIEISKMTVDMDQLAHDHPLIPWFGGSAVPKFGTMTNWD
jgi:hypothetical protein